MPHDVAPDMTLKRPNRCGLQGQLGFMSGTFRDDTKSSENFFYRDGTDVSIKKDTSAMFTTQEDRSKSSMSGFSLRINSPEPIFMPRAEPVTLSTPEPVVSPPQVPIITTSEVRDGSMEESESNFVSKLEPVHVSRLLKQYQKNGTSGPPPKYNESNASIQKEDPRYPRSLSSSSFSSKRSVSEERVRSTSNLSSKSFSVKPSHPGERLRMTRDLTSSSFNSGQHDSRPHSAVSDRESPMPPVGQSVHNSDYLTIPKKNFE